MPSEDTTNLRASSGPAESPRDARHESPHVSYAALVVSGAGFLLWSLGWFALIPNHELQLGWILEVLGPLLIAAAMAMSFRNIALRIGTRAVVLGILGAIALGVSTLPFGIYPVNLESSDYVAEGYVLYGIGLILGSVALLLVLAKKESGLGAALTGSQSPCPGDCTCRNIVHSSFSSITTGAIGLIVWGIGFLGLAVEPSGNRFDWILAAVGSLLVSVALTMHFEHLCRRFGRVAIVIAVIGAFLWSLAYVLMAINPHALPTSTWYNILFTCYGVSHLLTAVTMLLVARRERGLEH